MTNLNQFIYSDVEHRGFLLALQTNSYSTTTSFIYQSTQETLNLFMILQCKLVTVSDVKMPSIFLLDSLCRASFPFLRSIIFHKQIRDGSLLIWKCERIDRCVGKNIHYSLSFFVPSPNSEYLFSMNCC